MGSKHLDNIFLSTSIHLLKSGVTDSMFWLHLPLWCTVLKVQRAPMYLQYTKDEKEADFPEALYLQWWPIR